MLETQSQPADDQPDDSSASESQSSAWNRIVRWRNSLTRIVFVVAFLLAFPSHLTILTAAIAALIFGCLVFQQIRKAAWVSIVAGVILIIKTPSIQIDFIVMVAALVASGTAYFWVTPKLRWLAFTATVLAVVFFGVKRKFDAQASQGISLDQRSVVCLGDSLTEGTRGGYPAELQKLITQPVVNFGRNGYTTQEAIDDLLPKILDAKPQLVVMELGGHDYKDGEPRDQTKARLRHIIQELTDADIQVVIVEIPRGFISDPFYGVERELTAEFDLELIPDTIIRRFVYFSPIAPPGLWMVSNEQLRKDGLHPDQGGQTASEHLSDDGLHPNQRGQVEFAKVVADAIGVGD